MKIKSVVITALLAVGSASAQYHKYDVWEENYQVQALLGVVQYENLKFDAPGSDGTTEVDLSLLPQFGGAWMTEPRGGDRFQYGLETSFLMGLRFDKLNYLYAGSGGTYISLSVSMWTFDFAGGAYANLFLDEGQKVRVYLGAGPLLNFASYRTESDYTDDTATESESESAFGVGLYLRTGLEFRVHYRGTLGMGVRGSWSNVDFTEFEGGSSELIGTAAFVTYTAGF
jgi:opacity protein-like surface antigen